MSSLSRQQFHQLPLFVQAKELHSRKTQKGDLDPESETHGELMDTKRHEAETTGLTDDIRERGLKTPVWVDWSDGPHGTLVEGHHRVAAAHSIDPEMWVPVRAVSKSRMGYWHEEGL